MTLQDQTYSIAYGSGINTKTDSKQVVPGKLLRLENAVFTDEKRINKRNGNTSLSLNILGGGTISSPKLIKSYNDELLCAATTNGTTPTGKRLFSYSPTDSKWVDKGKYSPVSLKQEQLSESFSNQQLNTSAYLSGLTLFSWSFLVGSVINVQAIVVDTATKTILYSDVVTAYLSNGGSAYPKCVVLGGTKLAILVNQGPATGSQTLNCYTYSPTTNSFTLAGAVGTDMALNQNIMVNTPLLPVPPAGVDCQYDVKTFSSGAYVAYSASNGSNSTPINLNVKKLNTSGAVTASATALTSIGNICAIHINVDSSTGNVWVYWATTGSSGSQTMYLAIFDSTLSPVLAKTSIATTGANTWFVQITSSPSTVATIQTVYYQTWTNVYSRLGGSNILKLRVSVAGVVTGLNTQVLAQLSIYSNVFTQDSVDYLVANFPLDTTQSTAFLIDLSDNSAIARMYYGVANELRISGNLSTPVSPSSSVYWIPFDVAKSIGTTSVIDGASYAVIDFADTELYQSYKAGSVQTFNGGMPTLYDGTLATELGFNMFPQLSTAVTGSGGGIEIGTYEYFGVYEWFDGQGNLHQSAPSIGVSAEVVANNSTVVVKFTYLPLTQKFNSNGIYDVRLAIYRTLKNGIVAHKLYDDNQFFENDPTSVGPATYPDVKADSSIASNAVLYTTGGVIENIPPPAFLAAVPHNNRLFLVSSEYRNTVWYSKTISPGVGLSFSDLLTAQIGAAGGGIVALGSMDDKLAILEEKQPLIMSGDGANDVGTGSTFSFPQPIPSDVGCTQSKGVFTSPLGVHFKTSKGLYVLDRALGVKYWGNEVEAYNSQDLTSGLILPGTTRMQFLTSSGLSLTYDYFFGQWSTFTNFEGLSGDVWGGYYVYARSDGAIYEENTTSFLDNATSIAVKAQTAWIKGATNSGYLTQGFERIKEFLHLGEYVNGTDATHGVQVSIGYDYFTNPSLPSFSDPIPYYFSTTASSSGPFQYRQFLSQQKCEAATFLIEELPTGASGENFNLTDMALVAGIKKGAFKLPANTQSVG